MNFKINMHNVNNNTFFKEILNVNILLPEIEHRNYL